MRLEPLTAVSPVDGRYRATSQALAEYFSEYALMKMRVTVECEYLAALSETKGVGMRPLTSGEKAMLRALPHIDIDDAQIIQIHARRWWQLPHSEPGIKVSLATASDPIVSVSTP